MIVQFTPHPPTTLYIDINSCFASVEQQANVFLRGKPIVVAAYESNNGCILAASREAKLYNIQTGMRVKDARMLYPKLVVLSPDPEKYRYINHELTTLLLSYSSRVQVQSIDEMIVRMDQTPEITKRIATGMSTVESMVDIAKDIKRRIRQEIGDWITVSIGIAPNAFLGKTASNLKKPDGLVVITKENITSVLSSLALTDLCGIKQGNAGRLRSHGIHTPMEMYEATQTTLVGAFQSVVGRNWWLWLHGWETGSIYGEDTKEQKSFSQSCSLTRHVVPTDMYATQVVYQLVAKMASRLRTEMCEAKTISVGCRFSDRTCWQKHMTVQMPVFATEHIFRFVQQLLILAPQKPIHTVFVGLGTLTPTLYTQLSLDEQEQKTIHRTKAVDHIYKRFGLDAISSGITVHAPQKIIDRIAFGKHSL